jgi:hypothetical protein
MILALLQQNVFLPVVWEGDVTNKNEGEIWQTRGKDATKSFRMISDVITEWICNVSETVLPSSGTRD